jgi:hypothetical protein
MSICYWGDKFYGIDRIENAHLFDTNKEREIILNSLKETDINLYENIIENDEEIDFEEIDLYETANGIDDYIKFLDNTEVVCYAVDSCNGNLLFFGIDYKLPWEVTALKPQWEVDQEIYNAIKPILKDGVGFDIIKPRIQTYVINGQDDYVSYYELGK